MSRKKQNRKNRHGHFCWCCGRQRPNEKFSGKGHRRHLCRDCANLGSDELAYRQAVRDLERCLTWEGIIPRKRRRTFDRFLAHKDARIRAMAEEMQREDADSRAWLREEQRMTEEERNHGGVTLAEIRQCEEDDRQGVPFERDLPEMVDDIPF